METHHWFLIIAIMVALFLLAFIFTCRLFAPI